MTKARNPLRLQAFRWRRGWDSNPRALARKLISSQPRYDHFDTSPCLSQHLTPENHSGFWGELMGRTHMIFSFRSLRKPNEIKASGVWRVHKGHMISSTAPSTTRTTLHQPCVVRSSFFVRFDTSTQTVWPREYRISAFLACQAVGAVIHFRYCHSLQAAAGSLP